MCALKRHVGGPVAGPFGEGSSVEAKRGQIESGISVDR